MTRTRGPGRRAAVGASVVILVAGLVCIPAYVSSVGTAALAYQLGQECVSDLGTTLGGGEAVPRLDEAADRIGNLSEPVISREAVVTTMIDGAAAPRVMYLLDRPGQFDALGGAVARPGPGEVLVPEWATGAGDYLPGTTITVTPGFRRGFEPTAGSFELVVVGTYPTIPTRPEPAAWCSYREQLRFSLFGDPPPPTLLTVGETFDALPADWWAELWRVAPDPDGLRRDEARATIAGLQRMNAEERARLGQEDLRLPPVLLTTPLRRADQVADFVGITIAPLRFAATFVALVLVVSSAALVARADRRELRLRAMRGVGPVGLAATQLRWLVPTTIGGAVVGGVLGWLAVRVLGPSPEIEPDALRSGIGWGVAGWFVATVVAAGVVGLVGSTMVDRRRRRRVDLRIVAELATVGLAVWSFVRLDRYGGVRQIGVEVRGGDLLAQAFPLLGAIAVVVLLSRPTVAVLRRGRRTGRSLSPPLLLGLRRTTAEPATTAAMALASALAVAVAFQASALTDSVDRLLDDKAGMLVGADLSILVLEPPVSTDGLGRAATVVVRERSDDRTVRFLGVDPSTFAATARWRDDAAAEDVGELMAELAADPAHAAIVVDPDGSVPLGPTTVRFRDRDVQLDVVASARFFPAYSTGPPMFVVDRSVIDDRGDRAVLVADPVPGAADVLIGRGSRVTGTTSPAEIFDGTNFLSAQWSYAPLTAFAVLLAVVTLVGQVLVLEARLRARQVTHVLARPMGLRRRDELLAGVIEVGAPLAGGVLAGAATGWAVSRAALGRLDSLRTMQPPALLVVDVGAVVVAVVVAASATFALAALGAVRVARVDPAEVMRVAES